MKKILESLLETHVLFLVIALIFGLIFIKITPPLWGLDEPSHFDRVYQITRGEIIPNRTADNYGGKVPINLYNLGNYSIGDLVDDKTNNLGPSRKDVDNESIYVQFEKQDFSTKMHNSPSSSSYSPVAYIGPIIGVLLAKAVNLDIGNTLFLARLFTLLVYVSTVVIALLVLKRTKVKWLFFMIALLPTVMFQASVVTADNILIGLSLLFAALLIRLFKNSDEAVSQRLFLSLMCVGVLLPLVKVNYVFLSLAILLVPYNMYKSKNLSILIKFIGVSLAIFFGLLWSTLAKVTGQASISQRPDGVQVIIANQIANLVHDPFHFIELFIRSLLQYSDSYIQQSTTLVGWNYVSLPLFFIILLSIITVFATMHAKDEFIKFRGKIFVLSGFAILGLGSIFASFFITFTPTTSAVIQGVQGRYFIPFLIPIFLAVAILLPVRVSIKERMAPSIFGITSCFCLLLTVVYYYVITY
ncbi:MAG: DUF2142 domain-containing protein [Candidatus Saccharimonadales bacterium]